MTDSAEFPYRLAVGWVTVSTLEGSSSYLLTNFSVQSDQHSLALNPWGPPSDNETLYPAFARYGQYADGTQWADGPVNFVWEFEYFTDGMLYYWENSLIFGDTTTQSKAVTVKTRCSDGVFRCYQCYANRAKPNADYKRGIVGVENYKQYFVGGTLIT